MSMKMKVIDRSATVFLYFWIFFAMTNMNIFTFNVDEYNQYLGNVDRYVSQIFRVLAILTLLFLIKGKYHWLQKYEKVGWIVFFILAPYLIHEIPSINLAHIDNQYAVEGK